MSEPVKVIFFGTPDFALASAQACFDRAKLIAVVSQPDKARGRKQILSPSPIKKWAIEQNIPTFTPLSLKNDDDPEFSALLKLIDAEKPDLFIVTAYGRILPQNFLNLPTIAAVNVHASLLPLWRGAAPIQRSIEASDKETGVCLQKMVFELDAGDIISELKTDIRACEGARDLTPKLSIMGAEILSAFLDEIKTSKKIVAHAQDKTRVSFAKKIEKQEALYSLSWTAKQFTSKVKAFDIWPNVRACVYSDNKKLEKPPFIIILSAREANIENKDIRTGEILINDKKVFLKCSDKFSEILTIKAPGKSETGAFIYFQNLIRQSGQNNLKLDNL